MLRVKSLWVYCKLPPLMLCGERGISSRLNNGTICSVFLFSFLLFRMIYFKCCFNKWVLLLLLHYSTQYTLLWETVGISWEKSFINSLNIEQNKRLMWATCNHIYQIFLQQKGPACTSSRNTSITWQRMANFLWVSIFTQCKNTRTSLVWHPQEKHWAEIHDKFWPIDYVIATSTETKEAMGRVKD